jgi:AcrR family transcriptional regulator
MARRTLSVVDVAQILIEWHAGRSIREVARRVGVTPKTVRRYVGRAAVAGLAPGQPTMDADMWRALVRDWYPQLDDPHLRQPSWARIAPHHDDIARLREDMPVSDIHRLLTDEAGLDASLASLRRYVRANFASAGRR